MSPHAVNSFVTDLVAMAQAMERVPQLEARIAELESEISSKDNAFNTTLTDLTQARDYAASLEQRIHNVEVARDDAEMRFLELDEKAAKALDWLSDIESAAKGIRSRLEQPKPPEPVVKPTPSVEGQSEPLPIEALTPSTSTGSSTSDTIPLENADSSGWNHDIQPVSSSEVTQAQVDPTTVTHGDEKSEQTSVPSSAPSSATSPEPEPDPYSGKFYYDEPRYIPLELWIAGGGTEYAYNWRPEQKYNNPF